MDIDPAAVIEIFIPNRRFRRDLNGSICAVCHMRVHFLDAAVVKLPFAVKAIHQPCSALLIDEVQKAHDLVADGELSAAEEEDTAEARPEATIVAEEEA